MFLLSHIAEKLVFGTVLKERGSHYSQLELDTGISSVFNASVSIIKRQILERTSIHRMRSADIESQMIQLK